MPTFTIDLTTVDSQPFGTTFRQIRFDKPFLRYKSGIKLSRLKKRFEELIHHQIVQKISLFRFPCIYAQFLKLRKNTSGKFYDCILVFGPQRDDLFIIAGVSKLYGCNFLL